MKRKLPFLLLSLLFAGITIFAGYNVVTILVDYKVGADTYEDLQQYIHIETTPSSQPEEESSAVILEEETAEEIEKEPAETDLVWPEVDFEALQAINEDVVGWIYIEGTAVNYPIVKGPDNDFYLRKMIDGTYNNAGSIFMDYRSHSGFGDQHTVIYGHHMNSGTMFSDILNYKEQAYFDEHPVCLIMTPSMNYTLEFFTGYVASTRDDAWELSFSSGSEFEMWIQDSAQKSYFSSDILPTVSDHLVTLSTCSYEFNDARFVLVGVLEPAV